MKSRLQKLRENIWLVSTVKTIFYFAVFLVLIYIYIDNNAGSNFIYNEF